MQLIKLNLGCGPVQPDGWVNVDGSMRAKLASRFSLLDRSLTRMGVLSPTEFSRQTKVLDLRKRLPFATDSVDCIYAGELWEHFEFEEGRKLTLECFRVLKPGGVLRVCVPDGDQFWRSYIEKLDRQLALPPARRDASELSRWIAMFFRDICTKRVFGSMGHFHKWQYDEVQLVELFQAAGFLDATRRRFHESQIDGIEQVERSDFLIVEGTVPASNRAGSESEPVNTALASD